MKTFEMIARKRAEILGQKYLDEKGVNRAMYERDNIEDIIEELADANNIALLYLERIENNPKYPIVQIKDLLLDMMYKNTYLATALLKFLNDSDYPLELRQENIIRVGIDEEAKECSEQSLCKTCTNFPDNGDICKVGFYCGVRISYCSNYKKISPEQEIINQHETDKEIQSKQSLCKTCTYIPCSSNPRPLWEVVTFCCNYKPEEPLLPRKLNT